MAKRDALRQLSETLPARPEIEKILDSLGDKDDIHVAVIGVSIVEATLEQLIVSRLSRSDKKLLSRLFQNRGPLSDFNSKILIAEAFGIVPSPLAEELHTMRAIRNAFAHAKMPISFSDAPVAGEVNALKLLEAIREVSNKFKKGLNGLDNKDWFLLATRVALVMLQAIAERHGIESQIEEALRSQ
jgi:DNA-binding MltR family transcriptional regulator